MNWHIPKITALVVFVGSLAFGTPSAKAENFAGCKFASEAFLPAITSLTRCKNERCDSSTTPFNSGKCLRSCRTEYAEYIKIATSTLELCGPLEPQTLCRIFGDVTSICSNDRHCARANSAYNRYCKGKAFTREAELLPKATEPGELAPKTLELAESFLQQQKREHHIPRSLCALLGRELI